VIPMENNPLFQLSKRLRKKIKKAEKKEKALKAGEKVVTGLAEEIRSTVFELNDRIKNVQQEINTKLELNLRDAKEKIDVLKNSLNEQEKRFSDLKEKISLLNAELKNRDIIDNEREKRINLIKDGFEKSDNMLLENVEALKKAENEIKDMIQKTGKTTVDRINHLTEDTVAIKNKLDGFAKDIEASKKSLFDFKSYLDKGMNDLKSELNTRLEKEKVRYEEKEKNIENELKKQEQDFKEKTDRIESKIKEDVNVLRNDFKERTDKIENKVGEGINVLREDVEKIKKIEEEKEECPFVAEEEIFPFTAIVGQEKMKKLLILNAINPSIGGVLLWGQKGNGKFTAVRGIAEFVEAPECNFISEKNSCANCKRRYRSGITTVSVNSKKYKGEYRAEYVVDILSNVASINLDMGSDEKLQIHLPRTSTPTLLNTIGLKFGVKPLNDLEERVEVVRRRREFEEPEKMRKKFKKDQEALMARIKNAKDNMPFVTVPENAYNMIGEMCSTSASAVVMENLCMAYAAYDGRNEVTVEDIAEVAPLLSEE